MNFNSDILLSLLHKDLENVHGEIPTMRAESLKASLLKKYVPLNAEASLQKAAICDFIDRNDQLAKSLIIPSAHEPLFRTWRDLIKSIFHSGPYSTNILTLDASLQHAYAGPGSSRGTRQTDFVNKMFNSRLSYTSESLYRHYVSNISERWRQADVVRRKYHCDLVYKGSSLSAVPKDSQRCRTICTEPSLNMFYQLGAKHIIEAELKRFYKIDLSTQPDINKCMARMGSIHGALSTIDLKNASDDITMALVEYLLPRDTFEVLKRLRSPYAQYEGKYYELNMISTMGNGFTFPLMTLLFTTLFHALTIHKNMVAKNAINFAVFGDDIIIPTSLYSEYSELLDVAGFTVNHSKSFSTGFFRESCGGDYYKGHDVRGVYIRRIANEPDVYSAFNRLHLWSVMHDISLYRSLEYLKGLALYRAVPCHSGFDSGFIVPRDHIFPKRYDANGSMIYRSLEPVSIRRKLGDRYVNPWGALIGTLGGYVRNNTITLRIKHVNYRVVSSVTPCWDYSIDPNVRNNIKGLWLSWYLLLRNTS